LDTGNSNLIPENSNQIPEILIRYRKGGVEWREEAREGEEALARENTARALKAREEVSTRIKYPKFKLDTGLDTGKNQIRYRKF